MPSPSQLIHFDQTRVEFEGPGAVEAADGQPARLRRFRNVVYRGGILNLPNFRLPLVLDLQGLDVGDQVRPALLDHKQDADHVVGQTDRVVIEANELIAEGNVMGTSPEVLRAIDLNDKGFAWQSSVGATPTSPLRMIPAGHQVLVNGQAFTGPIFVATTSRLGEITFCVMGVDRTSSARIAASAAGEVGIMTFEQYCASMGFDPATLNEQQRASLQTMFEAQGAAPPEPAAASTAPPPAAAPAPAAAAPVAAAVGQLEISAADIQELSRCDAIHAICSGNNGTFPEIEASAVANNWDLRTTRVAVIRAARPTAPAIHIRNHDRNPQVIEASLCLASGISANVAHERGWFSEQVIEAAESPHWRNMSLSRFGHEIVTASGGYMKPGKIDTEGVYQIFAADRRLNDPMRQPIEAAGMSTLSLTGVLGNTNQKILLNSFMDVKRVIPQIAVKQSPSDYKQFKAYQVTMSGDIEEIGPDGELPDISMREEEFANQVKLKGAYMSVSEVTFVNDDLDVFSMVPKMFGRKCAINFEKSGFTTFLSTAGSFYSIANGNYMEGAGTALSIAALSQANQLAEEQDDEDGDPIMLQFNRILVPPALSITASDLYKEKNIVIAGATDVVRTASNPHAGSFAPLSSPFLGTKYGVSGSSDVAFYLLPENGDMSALQVAYLNGQETPTVERGEVDFHKLGIAWRVTFRFGFAKGQKRAVIKSKGSA